MNQFPIKIFCLTAAKGHLLCSSSYLVVVVTYYCFIYMTAKRPGDDAVGGEFKKPRVEVRVLRRAYKFHSVKSSLLLPE